VGAGGVSQCPRWSRDEVAVLEQLAGDVPFPDLMAQLQREAALHGWPPRTEKAVLMKIKTMGQRAKARQGSVLTTGGAAELLGCAGTRVEAWLRRRRVAAILRPRWVGKTRYIDRRSWRRLARELPEVLGGFSADALFLLLEDRDLADSVAAAYRRPLGDWRVRCVETGRIYRSCGAVAAEHHVTQACISLAIRERRPVAALGLTFEALRKVGHPLTAGAAAPA